MTVQAITLNLPQAVYKQIRQAAEKVGRPVNEVLLEAVAAVAPIKGRIRAETEHQVTS